MQCLIRLLVINIEKPPSSVVPIPNGLKMGGKVLQLQGYDSLACTGMRGVSAS